MILYSVCTNIAVNMTKVVIKILQGTGSAITQNTQGRLIVANFL